MGLAALGLFLFLLQSVTGKRDFQNVPVRAEILDERLAREGGRIAVRAVVFDSKVAGLALLLKELVVVTAVLASLLQVVLATIEVDHFVKHGRCSVLAGTVQKLGADVDFILALVLAVRALLPNLLSGAMAVKLRRRLDRDNRPGQFALEVKAVQHVERAFELAHEFGQRKRLVLVALVVRRGFLSLGRHFLSLRSFGLVLGFLGLRRSVLGFGLLGSSRFGFGFFLNGFPPALERRKPDLFNLAGLYDLHLDGVLQLLDELRNGSGV